MKIKIFFLILLSVFSVTIVSGQKNNKKIAISGFVTDADKKPVVGAMIFVDNKNSGIVTNGKGFYKVKTGPDAGMISVFTYNSGLSEAAINGKTSINFTLSGSAKPQNGEQVETGNEEKVNIGYGTVNRKDMTTTVNKIEGRKNKYASYQNVYEMLRGTVPGVQVNGRNIVIQGASSINLSSQPLFVVDGSIVTSIDDIQPFQVSSIEILKGASASIYGARGANGVICITLINGSEKGKQ